MKKWLAKTRRNDCEQSRGAEAQRRMEDYEKSYLHRNTQRPKGRQKESEVIVKNRRTAAARKKLRTAAAKRTAEAKREGVAKIWTAAKKTAEAKTACGSKDLCGSRTKKENKESAKTEENLYRATTKHEINELK